jgi:chromate reductase
MTPAPVQILLISGSLRSGSTNTAVVRTAALVAPDGVTTVLYDGLDQLPHFNPDDDAEPLDPAVAELRASIGAAGAVLISTPEYAGALPGSFKNVLDWSVGGAEMYGKAVAWINASAFGPTGATDAHESLRKVLGYTGSDIVEAACVQIPIPRNAIDADGLVGDPALRAQIARVLTTLATHVDRRRDAREHEAT